MLFLFLCILLIVLIHTVVVSVCPVVVSVGMIFVYVRMVYFLCAYCNCISTCVMNLRNMINSNVLNTHSSKPYSLIYRELDSTEILQ
jgi:hypothetical protein